jgi:hypothetical protein
MRAERLYKHTNNPQNAAANLMALLPPNFQLPAKPLYLPIKK